MKIYIRVDDPPPFFPAETESLNADLLDGGTYRLKNSSIFKPGVAYGDVVEVEQDQQGLLWLRNVVRKSEFSSVRLICHSCDVDEFLNALERATELGAGYSFHDQFGVAILTIPPEVSYRDVMTILNSLPSQQVSIEELAKRHN